MNKPTHLPIRVEALQLARRVAEAAQQLQGASTHTRAVLGQVARHLSQREPNREQAEQEIERLLLDHKLNDKAPESALLLAVCALLDTAAPQAQRPPTPTGLGGVRLSPGRGLRLPFAG